MVQKMHFFFFRKLQLITVLLLITRFLYELKRKVHLSKTVCKFSIFDSEYFLIKVYIFIQQNAWAL